MYYFHLISFNVSLSDPEWGSCSLGIFICLGCSGIHRNIPSIGKVKSLRLARWEDGEVQVNILCSHKTVRLSERMTVMMKELMEWLEIIICMKLFYREYWCLRVIRKMHLRCRERYQVQFCSVRVYSISTAVKLYHAFFGNFCRCKICYKL